MHAAATYERCGIVLVVCCVCIPGLCLLLFLGNERGIKQGRDEIIPSEPPYLEAVPGVSLYTQGGAGAVV